MQMTFITLNSTPKGLFTAADLTYSTPWYRV